MTRLIQEEGAPNQRIKTAVSEALHQWRQSDPEVIAVQREQIAAALHRIAPMPAKNGRDHTSDVLTSMPRRKQLISPSDNDSTIASLNITPLTFKASLWQALTRLFAWIYLIAYILLGNLWDKLRGQNTIERRATRLRHGLEKIGGTFVKFGQQVAMRIDLVPWAYCVELAKMLDKMPPFPHEQALAAIERNTGKPWDEIFAVFDPEPIGSASIACVYQAVLKDGSRVAVKIRRPGIGQTFMADFRVLDWIMDLIEFLTIVRPGFTRNLRREFQETLLEELDFTKEARFQEIFRRNSKKSGKKFFTAPKVYFEYATSELLVQEYVSGMWLWEVIATIEHQDPQGLAMMRRLNIDPRRVAKRILWASYWSMDENLFFHADPHPANIVVGQNSTLTFIDFGSCGSFNEEQRATMERVVLAMQKGDAEGMAQATLKMLEPFPPVDVPALMKEAEAEYMRVLYTFQTKAKHTEWWERTSARQWLALVKVSRQFNLPVNLHTLRMIRATLLYDTLVLRLDRKIDRYAEYGKFMEYRAGLAKKRLRKQWNQNVGESFFMRLQEFGETGEGLMIRAQHLLSSPLPNFSSVIDKWIFIISVLSRMVSRLAIVSGLIFFIVWLTHLIRYGTADSLTIATNLLYSPLFHMVILGVIIMNVRLILFRLRERDAQ